MARIAIFVDLENLRYSFNSNLSALNVPYNGEYFHGLDHEALCEFLMDGREIVAVRYYDALPKQRRGQVDEDFQNEIKWKRGLYRSLQNDLGAQIVLGRTQLDGTGRLIQKGVDARITSDILVVGFIDFYDTAVLISNDSDFVPTIQYVRETFDKSVEAVLLKMWNGRRQKLVNTAHELAHWSDCGVKRLNEHQLKGFLKGTSH